MIPDKVKIGGIVYTIRMRDKLARDYDNLGSSCANDACIEIDGTTPDEVQHNVLLHEIVEQINYKYELGLEHYKIKTIETALYQILKDNKLYFGDDKR